jgi:GNAT superfamily N-acetyltransferase
MAAGLRTGSGALAADSPCFGPASRRWRETPVPWPSRPTPSRAARRAATHQEPRRVRAGPTTPQDWRIACCYVGKGHRRQGIAAAALTGALDLIARSGGGSVERYPEDAGSVPAGFLYHGALSTYEKLGFARDRKIGKHRWVVTIDVAPS